MKKLILPGQSYQLGVAHGYAVEKDLPMVNHRDDGIVNLGNNELWDLAQIWASRGGGKGGR